VVRAPSADRPALKVNGRDDQEQVRWEACLPCSVVGAASHSRACPCRACQALVVVTRVTFDNNGKAAEIRGNSLVYFE
jgi:hypothetical protein